MRKKIGLLLFSLGALFISCMAVTVFSPEGDLLAAGPRDEYQKVQRDIRKQKKKLAEATRTEKSVVSDLRRVDAQISDIGDQITATKDQIKSIRHNISGLEGQITASSGRLETQREYLRTRLRTLQRINDTKEIMLMLISNEDPSTILRVSRSLSEVSVRYNETIKNYRAELIRLSDHKKKLNGFVGNLKSEENNLAKLEDNARAKKKEKEEILASVRKDKDTYQRMINELKEDSGRLQRIIRDADRREKSVKKKGSKGRQPEREDVPTDSAFTRMKGKLPWPVQGKLAIRYGSQIDPAFNLPVFRSGIHIRSSAGTTITAVAQGRVVYAAEFKGYGKMVVISHGSGYHTLYGNLSRIFSQNDAIIKENEPVGEAGDSTALGGSGLYFEIRYKGKPLDPQQWLRKSGG
jgi:septal ring factor EnvC (AmiA/AmiB activator)